MFFVNLRYNATSTENKFCELLLMLDKLTVELKSEFDPENNCIGLSLEHLDCQIN